MVHSITFEQNRFISPILPVSISKLFKNKSNNRVTLETGIAKLSLNSTQLKLRMRLALFTVSDKPPTYPSTQPPIKVVIWSSASIHLVLQS